MENTRLENAPHSRSVIMHIALQGCLKAGPIDYGVTADTGGHIRYLLELVEALAQRPEVHHQIIVTRAFDAPHLGREYLRTEEKLGEGVTLWRCAGARSDYLCKEDLWQELPHLTRALLDRMRRHRLQPDLIHAHYSDAGVVALKLKNALGVPYVFTPHSLGATKALHRTLSLSVRKPLRRRIRYEELAIGGAQGVITSSEHEARQQCGLYRQHRAGKTLVNPPGCDLPLFGRPAAAAALREVDAELKRFLRRPEKPCLLALARPVAKKNLLALVRAYGECPSLRAGANLVVYAGTRRDLLDSEPEAREVWQELLALIDRYDLYGDVAYPKNHDIQHVPAIYQWAARRKGLFVNPALNEPFGLTLLEAAASGLPVVATREGGPVNIVDRCRHGRLVDPTDIDGLAAACLKVFSNPTAWEGYSTRGRENVEFYSWARHADQYIKDMALGRSPEWPVPAIRPVSRVLATDMDGTLLGNPSGLRELTCWLEGNRDCLFVVVTGRSVNDALRELRAWSAPDPDFIAADVGSSLYQIDARGKPHQVVDWQRRLGRHWHRSQCQRVLSADDLLSLQPEPTQSAYKLSFQICDIHRRRLGIDHSRLMPRFQQRLAAEGLAARVILSHGNLLDIVPAAGGKAGVVEYLRGRLGIPGERVVCAGDSGNDLDLLSNSTKGIAVANHTFELEALRGRDTVYWCRNTCAAGIVEGLEFWEPDQQSAAHGRVARVPGKQSRSGPASHLRSTGTNARPTDAQAGA